MNSLIDWVEHAALENLRFRLQNAETLAKEAASTLTILIAGIGFSLAYAIKGYEKTDVSPLTVGVSALSVWMMLTGCLLIIFCMLSTSLPAPTNEPKNLYQKDFELDKLREVELINIQDRISQATDRNHRVAAWLDRVRLMAIFSPIIFIIGALVWPAH